MGSLGVRLAALSVVAACGVEPTDVGDTSPQGPRYRDVVELFDRGIAPTCSLNNGVCHNSNSYPDLHSVANLVATVEGPCNADATEPAQIHDVCEPPADHFVVPSKNIDARIVSAHLAANEMDLDVSALTTITLVLDAPPTGLTTGATDAEVRRGTTVFAVGEFGAKVQAITGAEVVLDIRSGTGAASTKRFFDVRELPPGPLRLHVGDPNGNGTEGAMLGGMPLVAAGDPQASYMMRRLVDGSFGELMPRQCRTWNDRGNEALACWINGLVLDADGHVTNAFEPIDYAACTMKVAGLGKCP